jgi:hypothetical protein
MFQCRSVYHIYFVDVGKESETNLDNCRTLRGQAFDIRSTHSEILKF